MKFPFQLILKKLDDALEKVRMMVLELVVMMIEQEKKKVDDDFLDHRN